MSYFKVLSGGEVVDAGRIWLRWDARHRCLMACDPSEAQYAQSYDGYTIYRFAWLNLLSGTAPTYPTAEATTIQQEEYEELVEILSAGETVPEPELTEEPEPIEEPTPEPEPPAESDRPMTVSEMRLRIMEMEEVLSIITGEVTES